MVAQLGDGDRAFGPDEDDRVVGSIRPHRLAVAALADGVSNGHDVLDGLRFAEVAEATGLRPAEPHRTPAPPTVPPRRPPQLIKEFSPSRTVDQGEIRVR